MRNAFTQQVSINNIIDGYSITLHNIYFIPSITRRSSAKKSAEFVSIITDHQRETSCNNLVSTNYPLILYNE